MKITYLLPIAFVMALVTHLPLVVAATGDGASVFDVAAPTVVFISAPTASGEKRTGSGVIVSPDAVLTNCHVVDGSTNVEVTFFDGKKLEGSFVGRYGNLDLCKVQVATSNRRPAKAGSLKDISPGGQV